MFGGQCKSVEERLQQHFRKEIGADTEKEDKSGGVSVNFDAKAKAWFASVPVGAQKLVKEFKSKEDAQHWAALVHALEVRGKLRGHISVIQKAEANRKASQDAYDKIIKGDGLLQAEDDPVFQKQPADGEDFWHRFFTTFEEKHPALRTGHVRVHKGSLEELLAQGSQQAMVAEMLGFKHKLLGWRVRRMLTHVNEDGAAEAVAAFAQASGDLSHVGFIRMTGDESVPTMTEADKEKLNNLRKNVPEAIAVIVGYRTRTGEMRAWEWNPKAPGQADGDLEEVELGTISRRVDGESFIIQPAKPEAGLQEAMRTKLQHVFQAHLQKSAGAKSASGEDQEAQLHAYRKIRIMGDGLCFWHAFMYAGMRSEYEAIPRNKSGGAKDRDRLVTEINRAKALHQEVQNLAAAAASPQPDLINSLAECTTVLLQHLEAVAQVMTARFRVTVDAKAARTVLWGIGIDRILIWRPRYRVLATTWASALMVF